MAKKADNEAQPAAAAPTNIVDQSITTEMRSSYLDYAMSVITSRALPDVRDGLNPNADMHGPL